MATKKRSTATKGRGKVQKVMHEYKQGTLKSGGRKKVRSRKQAVAIALSEARRSGANVPAKKKATKKKSATKKRSTAKKTGVRKKAAKKSS